MTNTNEQTFRTIQTIDSLHVETGARYRTFHCHTRFNTEIMIVEDLENVDELGLPEIVWMGTPDEVNPYAN